MARLRLMFMGTPEFALPTFDALVAAGHEIAAVYTRPPRPAGRRRALRRSPVHEAALARELTVHTPASLRDDEAAAAFATLAADAAVVCAYGLILPPPILSAPRFGCLNVHASLLPLWRGAAPIQRAIMAGDEETGVCVMQMDEGLDTGPVLLRESVAIGPATTGGGLHDELARLGARLMVEALDGLAAGRLRPTPQADTGVSYAAKLTPDEERLDWRRPAAELERQVRALAPAPGAWFVFAGERVKVLAARVVEGSGAPGVVLDARPTMATAAGALRLERLQRAGRKPMEAADFVRGFAIAPGTHLEAP